MHQRTPEIITGETTAEMISRLRRRDHDPAYAECPVIDAYARISINLTGELEKTDRQIDDILHAIDGRKVRLGEILRDDHFSAWKPNGKRPQFRVLMERIASGACKGAAVWRTDRLLRQPRELEALIDAADKGVTIFATGGEYNLDRSSDRTFLRIQVAMACQESDSNSERSKRKRAAMRAEGKRHSGRRPLGEYGTERGEVVPAEQVERERAAIRYAAEQIVAGSDDAQSVNLADIARTWTTRYGLTTRGYGANPGGDPMTANDVRLTFRSARVAGFVVHDGKPVGRRTDGEPIISADLFDRVQAVLRARAVKGRPKGSETAPLSGGFVFCGRCGKLLSARNNRRRDGRIDRQYQCRGHRHGACGGLAIGADGLEEFAGQAVAGFLASPEYARRLAESEAATGKATRAIEQAEADLRGLARRLAARDILPLEYEVLRPALVEAVRAAYDARAHVVIMTAPDATVTETFEDLLRQWTTAPPAGKRAMLRRARLRFTVGPATGWRQPASERVTVTPY